MSDVRPIPEGFHTLSPHLTVDGAKRAIEFYQRAFGAEVLWRHDLMESDVVMNAGLRIGSSCMMLNDVFPGGAPAPGEAGSPVTVHVYLEDVDAAWKRAVDAGATPVVPLEDAFWGDRFGILRDPFGHTWSLATHVEDVSDEELQARAARLFAEGGPA